MQDLIKQIEYAAAGSMADEIRLLKERRKSIDDVIKFAMGIKYLQKSLESVLLLKQPSKDIPRALLNTLGNISNSVANLPSNELSKRLQFLEKTIQQDIDSIMGVSNQLETLDPTTSGDSESKISTEKLHKLVVDFRRRTNTAIILKLHLRQRGVNVIESVIPVTTDSLVAQVSKLVIEEKKCQARILNELSVLKKQIGEIIDNPEHADNIKQYALIMRQQINANIEHLRQGKDFEKMPYVVEVIELGVSTEDKDKIKKKKSEAQPVKTGDKESINKETTDNKNKTQSGFIKKIFKWLASPWSVRWRDL